MFLRQYNQIWQENHPRGEPAWRQYGIPTHTSFDNAACQPGCTLGHAHFVVASRYIDLA
ncbi:hypothetical protein BIFGAL_02871 [Bifidobacterium gallicum DSM 20093 = LMG 11596]|uniref:Uncharacterized protein n=1 Tax=Bifidobacterium gallicum DSM 20093 = LMG 11596 TaxID=561180 RepID=D1NSW1_9BIFI|nr:hypothetical protein BIFGAL_02871 [Bifidobacterium gallicum DSM 20093 = LMG 11596]